MSELKACPFCGSREIVRQQDDYDFSCRGCGAAVAFFQKGAIKEAGRIAAWNRRADDAGRLREALDAVLRAKDPNRISRDPSIVNGWKALGLPASPSAEPCDECGDLDPMCPNKPAHPGEGGL